MAAGEGGGGGSPRTNSKARRCKKLESQHARQPAAQHWQGRSSWGHTRGVWGGGPHAELSPESSTAVLSEASLAAPQGACGPGGRRPTSGLRSPLEASRVASSGAGKHWQPSPLLSAPSSGRQGYPWPQLRWSPRCLRAAASGVSCRFWGRAASWEVVKRQPLFRSHGLDPLRGSWAPEKSRDRPQEATLSQGPRQSGKYKRWGGWRFSTVGARGTPNARSAGRPSQTRQVLRSGSLRLARGRGFRAVAASLPSQSPGLPTEDISRTGQVLYFQPDSLKAGPEGTWEGEWKSWRPVLGIGDVDTQGLGYTREDPTWRDLSDAPPWFRPQRPQDLIKARPWRPVTVAFSPSVWLRGGQVSPRRVFSEFC